MALVMILKTPNRAENRPSLAPQVAQLDPLGTASFLPGVVCLLLALQWGGSQYAWNDARVIALIILGAVLLLAFTGIQFWKQDEATVPLRVLKQRSVAAGFFFSFCNGAAMIIMIYFLPFWFQAIKGVDARQSGVNTIPLLLASTIGVIYGEITVTKWGYYVAHMIIGPALMAGLMTTFSAHTEEPR